MVFQGTKIINDPVYGFITIDHPLLIQIIEHPYYQRLRRIQQMAFANLVYPGAVHTRLHHSLGAYHLMRLALNELKNKGVAITPEEELGAKIAILLHDAGHGPFSHALENKLVVGIGHEELSIYIMKVLNKQFGGELDTAMGIFSNQYPKKFLHQLVSGQLDVDRMDYLTRDSFFTGVSEGVIGYDRIIKMLTVHGSELMVEEKAVYSIEKFLVSRRLMYWQVYLHKTVLSAEKMLGNIIERAKELLACGKEIHCASPVLELFLRDTAFASVAELLHSFCLLDDIDVMGTIKNWMSHSDPILSLLSRSLIDRRLFKVKLQGEPFNPTLMGELSQSVMEGLKIAEKDLHYFVFTGKTENTTYDPSDERIQILFKDRIIRDISQVDNALIHQTLASPMKKFYICYYRV